MKIILDARWIFKEISGIGLYTIELLRAIKALDNENSYTLLFNDPAIRDRTVAEIGIETDESFQTELVPYGVFSLKSQILMPAFLKARKADVFHSTNYMIPMAAFPRNRKGSAACIITIHDLIPLLFPDHAPKSKKARMMPIYRFVMRQVAARADGILTVSENSADDIRKLLLPASAQCEKVTAVYNGVSDIYRELQWRPSHDPQTLLYVGRLDPYKNVTGLIRIFDKVKRQMSQNVKLVIAGPQDPRYPEPLQLCRDLHLEDRVQWTGYLSQVQLLDLFASSTVLVHPAHYEGFGLPVAEAMAAGLPVVCSSGGSLAEIAGDAACVHDHNDEQAFADSICAILNSTARAKELSIRGRRQAQQFTWESAAKKTIAAYAKAVAQ